MQASPSHSAYSPGSLAWDLGRHFAAVEMPDRFGAYPARCPVCLRDGGLMLSLPPMPFRATCFKSCDRLKILSRAFCGAGLCSASQAAVKAAAAAVCAADKRQGDGRFRLWCRRMGYAESGGSR